MKQRNGRMCRSKTNVAIDLHRLRPMNIESTVSVWDVRHKWTMKQSVHLFRWNAFQRYSCFALLRARVVVSCVFNSFFSWSSLVHPFFLIFLLHSMLLLLKYSPHPLPCIFTIFNFPLQYFIKKTFIANISIYILILLIHTITIQPILAWTKLRHLLTMDTEQNLSAANSNWTQTVINKAIVTWQPIHGFCGNLRRTIISYLSRNVTILSELHGFE